MVDYIRKHPEIRDAIVSGGDPLSLPLEQLDFILGELRSIPHLEIIRIGTRVPVVLPMKIPPNWSPSSRNTARSGLTPSSTTHARSRPKPKRPSIDSARRRAGEQPDRAAAPAVNDDARTMLALNHALLRAKVPPTTSSNAIGDRRRALPHDGRGGAEDHEFRCAATLRLALPTYVIDLPAAAARCQSLQNYVIGENEQGLVLHNFEGKTYTYPNPARAARTRGAGSKRSTRAGVGSADAMPAPGTDVTVTPTREQERPAIEGILRRCGVFSEGRSSSPSRSSTSISTGSPAGLPGVHRQARRRRRRLCLFRRNTMTDGTFELYWIAVDPQQHRHGVGRSLMTLAEYEIARQNGR